MTRKTDAGSAILMRAGVGMDTFLRELRLLAQSKDIDPRSIHADDLWVELGKRNKQFQKDYLDAAMAAGVTNPPRDDGPLLGYWEFNRIAGLLNRKHDLDIAFSQEQADRLRQALLEVRGTYSKFVDAIDLDTAVDLCRQLVDGADAVAEFTRLGREGFVCSAAFPLFGDLVEAMVETGHARDTDHALLQLRALDNHLPSLETAARALTRKLEAIERKRGPEPFTPYDHFVIVMAQIAIELGISLTRRTNRVTGRAEGPFLALVRAFEVFLPNAMRAKTAAGVDSRIRAARQRHRDLWGSFTQKK